MLYVVLDVGQLLLELRHLDGLDVVGDEVRQMLGFARRQLAGGDRIGNRRQGREAVLDGLDLRQLERDGPVLARRAEPIEAEPQQRRIAVLRHLDRLLDDRFGVVVEQLLHRHRDLVARSRRPAARVAGLAGFEQCHVRSPSLNAIEGMHVRFKKQAEKNQASLDRRRRSPRGGSVGWAERSEAHANGQIHEIVDLGSATSPPYAS